MIKIEEKVLSVGKAVSTAHVDQVIRNYKQERWVHNSERLGKADSLSAWWSVDEVEDFLERIKTYGGDGVKFYFAAYDEKTAPTPEYIGLQTIVMVASKQKEGANNTLVNKDVYISKADGTNSILAYNAANLCPPLCGRPKTTLSDDDTDIGVAIVEGNKGNLMVI